MGPSPRARAGWPLLGRDSRLGPRCRGSLAYSCLQLLRNQILSCRSIFRSVLGKNDLDEGGTQMDDPGGSVNFGNPNGGYAVPYEMGGLPESRQ